jgi:hypothetical protein
MRASEPTPRGARPAGGTLRTARKPTRDDLPGRREIRIFRRNFAAWRSRSTHAHP